MSSRLRHQEKMHYLSLNRENNNCKAQCETHLILKRETHMAEQCWLTCRWRDGSGVMGNYWHVQAVVGED